MKEYKLKEEHIKRIINYSGSCIASDRVTVDGRKIGYMYRENPTNEFDTGWRFFAGDEDEQYTGSPDNFGIFELNTICNYDESIIPYLNKPIDTKLEKSGEDFKEII